MSKNDNTIFWVIGFVVLVFLILPKFQIPEPGMIGLTPHYYKDGVEVFPEFNILRFSIVTPPGESFDQIAFSISGTNTGALIDLKIVDASPLAFKDALPSTIQNLAVGESKILWTSALMETAQFEAVSPVNFWVKISGENPDLGIVYEVENSGDITFEAELFGDGSDGVFIFTLGTKDYGNLVIDSDYKVSGDILYLKVDRVFKFTNFTLGLGTELRPWNPSNSGTVIYLKATDTIDISGTVKSNFQYAYTQIRGQFSQTSFDSGTINGIISTPGVANGGSGGAGGRISSGALGGSGGSQSSGYGGGGGGGAVCGSACSRSGGAGGTGGVSPIGGASQINTHNGNSQSKSGAQGFQSGGGSGAAMSGGSCDSGFIASGKGGGSHSSSGSNAVKGAIEVSCGAGGGGGGGAGGNAGHSGIHFYAKADNIYFTGTIITSGTRGGFGGNGGSGAEKNGVGSGGGGGGGGGGGNAGNIILSFNNSIIDTGIKILNGGNGGAKGLGGSGVSLDFPILANDGSSGSSGSNGVVGTSNVGVGFCIACWMDKIFG